MLRRSMKSAIVLTDRPVVHRLSSHPTPRGPGAGSDLAIAGGRMSQSNYRVMVLLWLALATAATFAAIARALEAGQFVY
jgi:hypothetical protein